jgi:hypothetical protein
LGGNTTLTKEADKDSYTQGETITYTIRETNTGDADIDNVVVTDSFKGVLGPAERQPDDPGNNDDILDVDETWVFEYERFVTVEDPCVERSIHNEVNATGEFVGTDTAHEVERAEETVRVTCPPIIVGGEILGIDAPALFIAGAAANAYTILPILGAIAGALYFAARRWK